jgi:hypothetical protein
MFFMTIMMSMIILKVKEGDNCDNLASGPRTEGYGNDDSLAVASSGNKNYGVLPFLCLLRIKIVICKNGLAPLPVYWGW